MHACRFVGRMESDEVFLKVDSVNAFNSFCRDKMLGALKQQIPILVSFVHSFYSSSSLLL